MTTILPLEPSQRLSVETNYSNLQFLTLTQAIERKVPLSLEYPAVRVLSIERRHLYSPRSTLGSGSVVGPLPLTSISTCVYIVVQLFKLSPQEAVQDPIYHVLLRHPNKNINDEQKMHYSPVIMARTFFGALGCLMFGTLLYTILTDGSPFRKELLTSWMVATLIDFYINVIALSVWVAYKESSLIGAVFWIILLICFGSITTCAYIVRQLFQLTPHEPLYLVLFKYGDRKKV